MAWQQLHITIDKMHADAIEALLLDIGCVAVTFQAAADEDLFQLAPQETCLWQQNHLTALFPEEIDLSEIIIILKQDFPDLDYVSEKVEDQAWERAWLNDFKPMQFGKNTWICPTSYEPPEPQAINILLDPGLAFGTGTHATTALCLTWIDSHNLQQKNVIDYGCGSGILAIAALKHGAKQVIAVDHDTQALSATKDNALRNQIDLQNIIICLPEDMPTSKPADIILANILAEPLIGLAEVFSSLLIDQGHIILSGILHTQADMIVTAYQKFFDKLSITPSGDWLLITGEKKT